MFKRLLWKEWRENQWKLVFGGAVSLAFTALLFRIRLFPDATNAFVISLAQMLVMPVIYALDIFSGEISSRTIHLLFKFPVPRWKIFFSKYLVCIAGIALIFLLTGVLMEILGHGREAQAGFLFRHSFYYAVGSLLVFTWYTVFGAQNRSEAASLVTIFAVMIGWGIVYFWAHICQVRWALHFVPYFASALTYIRAAVSVFHHGRFLLIQAVVMVFAISLACYRFVKVRRYL
jgi:ABC-type transport system involved in multi-copper enzyme maturation permease subunit